MVITREMLVMNVCRSVESWKNLENWTILTLSTRRTMAIILVSMEYLKEKQCHMNSTYVYHFLSEDPRFQQASGRHWFDV